MPSDILPEMQTQMNKKTLKSRLANWAIQFLKNMHLDLDEFEGKYHRLSYERNETNARWIFKAQMFSDLNLHLAHFPDRYTARFDRYNRECGFFEYADLKKWVYGNHQNNAADLGRFFFLNQCFELLLKEKIDGHVAELGVYKGNSAFLLNKYANTVGKTCYLFDTFEGFDQRDLVGVDAETENSFADTSLQEVKKLVGTGNTVFVKGYFPESLSCTELDGEFAFVHIDCDLEKPFKAALEYFYPRLCRGGFLVMYDYSNLYWPGTTKTVDEFFYDKPEFIIPVPDKSGSCVVRKI